MPLSVFFIVLLSVGAVLAAALFLPVTFVVQGSYQEHFIVKLHIRIFGKRVKSIRLYPKKKGKGKGVGNAQDGGQPPGSKKSRRGSVPRPSRLMKKVETAFFIKCCIGLPDAASTAMSTGILQGIFNGFLIIPEYFTNMKVRQVEVLPSYSEKCFIFNGVCIVRATLGNIIIGILHYKKVRRK